MFVCRFSFPLALVMAANYCSALAATNPPKPAKIAPDNAAYSAFSNFPVIIQYKNDPEDGDLARLAGYGGALTRRLHSAHAVAARISPRMLQQLADDPNVTYVSPDRPLKARDTVSVTALDYSVEPINAPATWANGYVGTNIGVAVIDSGVQPVQDLGTASASLFPGQPATVKYLSVPGEVAPGNTGRIVYSQNFVTTASDATDQYGHGTHVSGLIAANGALSTGKKFFYTFYGAAPNANIINLRALDQNGEGTDSSVIAAIDEAIALQAIYNIRVINLSLGRPIFESYTQDPLCQAVELAWKAGIVVVVAAGNDGRDLNLNAEGYGTINAPGNDPYVITVGAMRSMETPAMQDDLIASYSSKGPSFIDDVAKPDVVAPGNLVVSLQYGGDWLAQQNPSFMTPKQLYQFNSGGNASKNYFPLSGTSMATAVTSGAIADLLQAAPTLTPDQVKALVMLSADRSYFPQTSSVVANGVTYNANYDVFTIGAGYLDINATINTALVGGTWLIPAGTAMSPIATFNATTGNTTLLVDQTALWGKTGLWSCSNVYGNKAFESNVAGSTALWGQTALWGKEDPNAYTALWGQSSSWSTSSPQAATALWGQSSGGDAASAVSLAY